MGTAASGKSAIAALLTFRRAREIRTPKNWPETLRLPLLLAGLVASLLVTACSGEAVTDPEPPALTESPSPTPDQPPAAAARLPQVQRTQPAQVTKQELASRHAPAVHPYARLWQAATLGVNDSGARLQPGPTVPSHGTVDSAPAEAAQARLEPASDRGPGTEISAATTRAADPDAPRVLEPGAGNAPEIVGAPAEDSVEEPASNGSDAPPEGRQWHVEDYAQLAPYLQGVASWYGPNFHGKLTANGETYNQYGLTAAHPVLPIGTRILVENLNNGRRVWLRINDRGPYAKGRVLDLSRIAAERLGMIEQGTAPVRITVLKWPESMQASLGLKAFQQYTVQSAAYPDLDTAEELRERLQARFPDLPFFVDRASNGFFAVAAGPFDDEREARQVSRRIHRTGLDSLVKRYRN